MAKMLVVDDEPGYLELLNLILKADGHEVETAVSGEKAIEVGQRFHPDVLLTDWKLKENISGLDVARKLIATNPDLVTVVMTGYSAGMLRSHAPDLQDMHILEKPFDTDALLEVIRQVMD